MRSLKVAASSPSRTRSTPQPSQDALSFSEESRGSGSLEQPQSARLRHAELLRWSRNSIPGLRQLLQGARLTVVGRIVGDRQGLGEPGDRALPSRGASRRLRVGRRKDASGAGRRPRPRRSRPHCDSGGTALSRFFQDPARRSGSRRTGGIEIHPLRPAHPVHREVMEPQSCHFARGKCDSSKSGRYEEGGAHAGRPGPSGGT